MGRLTAPWAAADCACCEPGTATKAIETIPMPTASRYALIAAVREKNLPREVLQRIVASAVERRVVTRHNPLNNQRRSGRARHDAFAPPPRGDPLAESFSMMTCVDIDDVP